jgi:Protein of unknown function (DUF3617)
MRLAGIISLLGLIHALPASAAELPSRKPGLWEVRTAIGGNDAQARVIKQCINAATDQMLRSDAGPFSSSACPQRDVRRSENSITIDSVCTVNGKPATAHALATGNFDSQYKMTVTAESEALPGGKMMMTLEGKWLGPCAADQRPGDIIMSNGMKINVPEVQKGSSSQGASPPPK